jgi:hypothetical protein
MQLSILCLKWTGLPLSDDEYSVLSSIASKLLTTDADDSKITFSHEKCSGTVTRGNGAAISGTGGTTFRADISTPDQSRVIDFMLPVSYERVVDLDNKTVFEIGTSIETIERVELAEVPELQEVEEDNKTDSDGFDDNGFIVVPDAH